MPHHTKVPIAAIRILGGLMLCGASTAMWAAVSRSGATSDAPLVAEEPVTRLGDVSAGERRDVSFLLTNLTGRPVEIVNVFPECTCNVPEIKFSRIAMAAREKRSLTATWIVSDVPKRDSTKIAVEYRADGDTRVQRLVLTAVAEVLGNAGADNPFVRN